MPLGKCSIPDCPSRPQTLRRGYCETHYRRLRDGLPLDTPVRQRRTGVDPEKDAALTAARQAPPMRKATTGRKRQADAIQTRNRTEDLPDDRPEIEAAKGLPFEEWARRFLKIRNKHRKIVPFELNAIQRRLDAEWERQMRERGHVQIIVLKARKEGVSSYVQGKMFRAALENAGCNVAILAHHEKSCKIIFDRTRKFAESVPDGMKRSLQNDKQDLIKFADPHDSYVFVQVVVPRGSAGRGGDVHMEHFSEAGFYERVEGETAEEGQILGLMGAIPEGVTGTAVVIESTANGPGNEFAEMWAEASDERGTQNGFVPMFFSWMDFEEYRRDPALPLPMKPKPEWVAEEATLRARGADDWQIAWRNNYIATKCKGRLQSFWQEMPSTPEESFRRSSGCPFDAEKVGKRQALLVEKYRRAPATRGDLAGGLPTDIRLNPAGEREVVPVRVIPDGEGPLRIYVPPSAIPDAANRLVLVADPAGVGSKKAADKQKGDPACAYVWDREKNEQVAEYHGWMPGVDFARGCYRLARFYGSPLVIYEANTGGQFYQVFSDLHYARLYHRENVGDDFLNNKQDFDRYGWWTTNVVKPRMIEALVQLWHDGPLVVNSPECCGEHLTFMRETLAASKGRHDDRVICCGIYAKWSLDHAYVKPREAPTEKKPWGAQILDEVLAGADRDKRRAKRL